MAKKEKGVPEKKIDEYLELKLRDLIYKSHELSKQHKNIAWPTVRRIIGGNLLIRLEDQELVTELTNALGAASAGKIRLEPEHIEQMRNLLKNIITNRTIVRVEAVRDRGWLIRRKLAHYIAYLGTGENNTSVGLEIRGRGENKVGFLETWLPHVQKRVDNRVAFDEIQKKLGYPTDIVIQKKQYHPNPEPNVAYLLEVEPKGLRGIARKIRLTDQALRHRFLLSQRKTARLTPERIKAMASQLPRERIKKRAIAFFIGDSPTIKDIQDEITRIKDRHAENGNFNGKVKRKAKRDFKQFQEKYEHTKPLERQLHEAMLRQANDKKTYEDVRDAVHDVELFARIGNELHTIDLKKVAAAYAEAEKTGRNPLLQRISIPFISFGKKNRVTIGERIQGEVLSLEALRKTGTMQLLGRIREPFHE